MPPPPLRQPPSLVAHIKPNLEIYGNPGSRSLIGFPVDSMHLSLVVDGGEDLPTYQAGPVPRHLRWIRIPPESCTIKRIYYQFDGIALHMDIHPELRLSE